MQLDINVGYLLIWRFWERHTLEETRGDKIRGRVGLLLIFACAAINLDSGVLERFRLARSGREVADDLIRRLEASGGKVTIELSPEQIEAMKRYAAENPKALDMLLRDALSLESAKER